MANRLSAKKIEELAEELRNFLLGHYLWVDTTIYFNGKAFSTDDRNGNYYYNDPHHLVVLKDQDPKAYTKYAGDILTMTFEGDLYELLNNPGCFGGDYGYKLLNEFEAIFKRYGLYYEFGNAWNLTAYQI